MEGCKACDLSSGRVPLPGGTIHETKFWLVEHCIGPLGLGTLIVKLKRHVTAVAELTDAEATELGLLLRDASAVASELVGARQVYNCLWSHADGTPVHIHFVIQPVTAEQMDLHDASGPRIQVAMFDANQTPPKDALEQVADRAREIFGARRHTRDER